MTSRMMGFITIPDVIRSEDIKSLIFRLLWNIVINMVRTLCHFSVRWRPAGLRHERTVTYCWPYVIERKREAGAIDYVFAVTTMAAVIVSNYTIKNNCSF